MRSGEFKERHVVTLNDEQRALFARQATRQAQALERHHQLILQEEDEWKRAKEKRKEREAELDEMKKKMEAALFVTSNGVETGRMEMEVRCKEELVGAKVITFAIDTGEEVDSRDANKAELKGAEPVAAAAKAQETEAERAKKIDDGIEKLLGGGKPRAESWLLKQLAKGVPEATPEQIKAAVVGAMEAGRVVEDDGKLVLIKVREDVIPGDDDGIVPDDYQPTAH